VNEAAGTRRSWNQTMHTQAVHTTGSMAAQLCLPICSGPGPPPASAHQRLPAHRPCALRSLPAPHVYTRIPSQLPPAVLHLRHRLPALRRLHTLPPPPGCRSPTHPHPCTPLTLPGKKEEEKKKTQKTHRRHKSRKEKEGKALTLPGREPRSPAPRGGRPAGA